MSKDVMPEEVVVLRFFESGALERVEPVFNIVSAKMRERLGQEGHASEVRSDSPRRRRRPSIEAESAGTATENRADKT